MTRSVDDGFITRCSRYEEPCLREPKSHALIACQIQTGPGRTWTDRTYEVRRGTGSTWWIDFGEGLPEEREDWATVVRWLVLLRPRDVEMLELP